MVSARPRRSAAPDSYQVAFPELTSSSSGDSEDSDAGSVKEEGQQDGTATGFQNGLDANENNADADGAVGQAGPPKLHSRKRKKRGAPEPTPDEDMDSASGSEFEPEVVKDKDGKTVEEVVESDSFSEEGVEESESGDSAAGEKELDGISIASSGQVAGDISDDGGKQGLKHGLARSNQESRPAMRIVGRAGIATGHNLGQPKREAARKRCMTGLIGAQKKLGIYEITWGPAYWPPALVLAQAFEDNAHTSEAGPDAAGLKDLGMLSEAQRLHLLKRISYQPFGPHNDSCIDLGWYPGKWMSNFEGETTRAGKWGGYYDSVPMLSTSFELVNDLNQILPHLPRNVYSATPGSVHLTCKSETVDKAEDNEDDNWDDMMAVDSQTTAQPASNAAEAFRSVAGQVQSQVGSVNANPAQNAQESQDSGVFKFLIGPIMGEGGFELPQIPVELERLMCLRLDTYLSEKPGYILNAGGPVFGLDWCPQADDDTPASCEYLAVSTVAESVTLGYRLDKNANHTQSMIQIWSMSGKTLQDLGYPASSQTSRTMRLDLALLVDAEVLRLQWCPKGGAPKIAESPSAPLAEEHIRRLGVIAALTTSKIVYLYDVPTPESARHAKSAAADDLVFLRSKAPLLTLDLGKVPVTCLEWMSHDRIAVGTSTGHVAVFEIGQALEEGARSVGPMVFAPVHESTVTAISVIRRPPLDRQADPQLDAEPTMISTTSTDGSVKMLDLLDQSTVFDFGHERAVRQAIAYQPMTDTVHYVDQEMGIRFLVLKAREFGSSTRVVSQNGPVLDLACSDFHSFFASASADGTCAISNTVRRGKRAGHAMHYLNKVFRMDFNRNTGTFRMIDNIVTDCRTSTEGRGQKLNGKKGKKTAPGFPEITDTLPSFAWSPEVAVNCVAWSRSLRRAHMLASGLACGLVRVDLVQGNWSAEASVNTRESGIASGNIGDDSD